MNKLSKLRLAYRKVLRTHPITVNAIQTGLLISSGDIIAQTLVERKKLKEFNSQTTLHFFLIGFGLVGPCLSLWYRFLTKLIGSDNSVRVVASKVALDQILFAPTFLFIFITSFHVLQGKDWNHIKDELRKNYLAILVTNYSVWPLAQMINFYSVPLRYQVLFAQLVAVFWNVYLCWKTRGKS